MLKIDAETEALLVEKIGQILLQGQTVQNITTDECVTEIYNGEGELIRTNRTSKTRRSTSVLPTPTYILELLVNSLSVESATELLSKYGYLVINPEAREEAEQISEQRGLTEFAVNELRAKLLGVELEEEN